VFLTAGGSRATGWDIGHEEIPDVATEEIGPLYDKLEHRILPGSMAGGIAISK
jgi:hypothetical protein